MKRFFILHLLLFLALGIFGTTQVDSLIQKIDTTRKNVETIDLYYLIAEQLQKNDNKLSLIYSEKGIELSTLLADSSRIARGLLISGKSLSIMGLYNFSLQKFTECRLILDQTNDSLQLGSLHKNMGSVNWFLSDFKTALTHYKKALPFILKTNEPSQISGILFNIGLSYSHLNNYDSTIFYMDTALQLAYQINDSALISHIIIHKGGFLLHRGMLEGADEQFQKAQTFEKVSASNMNSLLFSNMAQLKMKRNDFTGVKKCIMLSKEYASKSKSLFAAKQALETELSYDTLTQNYTAAFHTLLKLMEMKDSLTSVDYHDKLSSFQALHELKQKESEIKILKSENDLFLLKNKQNRLWIWMLSLIFLLMAITLIVIFQSNRQKNQSIATLNELNIELKAHKEEMTALNEELSMNQEELYEKNTHLETTISQLKLAQNQLLQSEKMASMGILVRGIAHELVNPLNFVNGGIAILQDIQSENPHLAEKTQFPIDMMNEGIIRAVTIVQQLSSFVDQGNSEPQFINLNQIIKNTLVFLNYKIDLETKLIEDFAEIKEFKSYPDKIHAIFFQLITNAIDASKTLKTDKVIKVTTAIIGQQQGSFASIKVYNSGDPIPETILPKIFDPFFTTKDARQGSGMGLTVAFNLIKELKGNIEVMNVDKGVEFIVSFPINNDR